MDNFVLLKDKIPEKGKHIVAVDKDGYEYFLFRCNCNSEKCITFRDILLGYEMIVDIVKWKYEVEYE